MVSLSNWYTGQACAIFLPQTYLHLCWHGIYHSLSVSSHSFIYHQVASNSYYNSVWRLLQCSNLTFTITLSICIYTLQLYRWKLCCQPIIRCLVKFLLIDMDFNIEISQQHRCQLATTSTIIQATSMLFELPVSDKLVLGYTILWLRDLLIFTSHGWQVSNSTEHLERAYSDEQF